MKKPKYRPDFFNLIELRCVDRRAKLTREKLKCRPS